MSLRKWAGNHYCLMVPGGGGPLGLKVRKRLEQGGAVYSGSNKFTVDGDRGRGLIGVKLGQAPASATGNLEVVRDRSA